MRRLALAAAVVAGLFTATGRASAGPLLTGAAESQLETWLGQGDLTFTQIFSHESGDGKVATDFHAAADGRGATVSILRAFAGGQEYIIGGYNPRSWVSSDNYNYSPTDGERTAFLFNLTSGTKQNQNLYSEGWYNGGYYQTYNSNGYGPTFGGGHDLYVQYNLDSGYTFNYSYGGTSYGTNLLGAGPSISTYFTSTQLEVYTFSPAPTGSAVPEPASMSLLAFGAVGMAGYRLRRRLKKAEPAVVA